MSIDVDIGFDTTTHVFTMSDSTTAPPGRDRIVFRRVGKHPGWTFFGISVWPEGGGEPSQPGDVCAPFTDPPPSVNHHSIALVDSNPGTSDATFRYKVWVTNNVDGKRYCSDPEILNKGG